MKRKAQNILGVIGIVFILCAQMSLVYEMGRRSVAVEIMQ